MHSDELTGVTLNLASSTAERTIEIISKLILSVLEIRREKMKIPNQSQDKVSSKEISDIKSGEVSLDKLIKNAKETGDQCVRVNEGLTQSDKDFLIKTAKEYNIPLAFREQNKLNYAILKNSDVNTYKQMCTEMIASKLALPKKEYSNFAINQWEIPYLNNELNKFGLSAQFGQTADEKHFCLFKSSDEQAIKIARGEFVRKYRAVMNVDIDKISDKTGEYYKISDNNGHNISLKADSNITYNEMSAKIQSAFSFDKSKANLLAARFGEEQLSDEAKEVYFNNDIRSEFSKIQTNVELQGESIYCKPYFCMRLKPKADEIAKLVYADEKGNIAILSPEKMSSRKMKSILSEQFGIKDKETLNALIDKARRVTDFYIKENKKENKTLVKDFEGITTAKANSKVTSIESDIVRNDKDTFTVKATATFLNTDSEGLEHSSSESNTKTFSFSDAHSAIVELQGLYQMQGLTDVQALEMAEEVFNKAEAQSAEHVVEIDMVQADRFFGSDIEKISSAKAELSMGDKHLEVDYQNPEKAKEKIMDNLFTFQ